MSARSSPSRSPARRSSAPGPTLAGLALGLSVVSGAARADEPCRVEVQPGTFVSCAELLDRAGEQAKRDGPSAVPERPSTPPTPVRPAAATDDDDDECRLEDEQGRTVSCRAFLDAREAAKPSEPAGSSSESGAGSGLADRAERDARGLRALEDFGKGQEAPALVELRRSVIALEAEVTQLGADPRRWMQPRLEAKQEELRWRRKVLDGVEAQAVERMVTCSTLNGNPVRISAVRMTPGGPVPLSAEEIQQQVGGEDPKGCERSKLVSAELIAKVERKVEIERRLETESFGWHRRDERRTLEGELERLTVELDPRRRTRRPFARPTRIELGQLPTLEPQASTDPLRQGSPSRAPDG